MVAGLIAFSVGRLHLAMPGLAAARPIMIIAILAIGLYLLDATRARRLHTVWRGPTPWLLAMLFWMGVGLPTALRQYRTLAFIVNDFMKTALVFVLVAATVRALRDVERLAWTYFAAAVTYAIIIVTRFQVGEESWRLGELITYDSNDFAVLVVTALPLGVYSAFRPGRTPWARAFDWAGLTLLAITFVWAGSRGGFLALLAVAAFFLVRYRAVSVAAKASTVLAIAVVVAVVAGPRFWEQMSTVLSPSEDYNFTSETGRVQVWKRGIGYMRDNPFLGVGASNFPVAEGTLSPIAVRADYGIPVRWTAAHNAYIEVGAELGFPGLVLYLGFLTTIMVVLARTEKVTAGMEPATRARVRGLSEALMTAMIGFIVGTFFLSLAYSSMLYVLAALSVGLDKAIRGSETAPARTRSSLRPRVPSTAWNLNSSST